MSSYETWTGGDGKRAGRIRHDPSVQPTYIIRRQQGGQRYEVSTGKHSLDEARVELALFLRDADAYVASRSKPKPKPPPRSDADLPIFLDVTLAKEFLDWSLNRKANTPRWVHEQKLYLDWWEQKLRGIDLRRANYPDHIRPALEGVKSYRPRVATILALHKWLRRERDLALSEDPVQGRFFLPGPDPGQARRNKAVPLVDLSPLRSLEFRLRKRDLHPALGKSSGSNAPAAQRSRRGKATLSAR